MLRGCGVAVVISESCLPAGQTWRDLLAALQATSNPPPLIVTDRLADDQLWAEVLNLGGYDLLAKPFDAREVLRTVQVAHRLRNDPPGPVDARQKPLKSEAVGLP